MRLSQLSVTLCLAALACADATSPASRSLVPGSATQFTILARDNVVLPLDLTPFNSCTGEPVHVTGEVHLVAMTSRRPDGSITDVFHTNFRNATGVGLVSGDAYRATSAESAPFQGVFPRGPWRSTHEGTLHLISGSGGSNFLLHFVFVVTKEPGAPPDIVVSKFDVSCT